jgi:hypothetical protein
MILGTVLLGAVVPEMESSVTTGEACDWISGEDRVR